MTNVVGPFGQINPKDHPVGTRLFVLLAEDGPHAVPMFVEVDKWESPPTSVYFSFLRTDKSGYSFGRPFPVGDVAIEATNIPVIYLNINDHPQGTRMVVKGSYGTRLLEETQVEVCAWTSPMRVGLKKINGSPFYDDDQSETDKIWFNANTIEVVSLLPRVSQTDLKDQSVNQTTLPFTEENYPVGSKLKINISFLGDNKEQTVEVKTWNTVNSPEGPVDNAFVELKETSSVMDHLWLNASQAEVIEIFTDDVTSEMPSIQDIPFDRVPTHPDELRKDFFHLLAMLNLIADQLGYEVEVGFRT